MRFFVAFTFALSLSMLVSGCGGGGTAAPANAQTNLIPVANAGAAQNVVTGTQVTLNGSASTDANSDPLTYSWTLTSKPVNSTAALAGATSATPTFTADLAGTYVATLIVNDGQVNSAPSTVAIIVNSLISGTISGLTSTGLVLQNNGGDNITIPPGSTSFTFPTSAAFGSTYDVSVLTQPTFPPQDCAVTNGTNTVSSALINISISCSAVSGFAYVVNAAGIYFYDTIEAYTINANTGTLNSIGTLAATGYNPVSIVIDPTGKYAFVANAGESVSVYSINAGTGALTNISIDYLLAGTSPRSVTVDPTGKFVYVASETTNSSNYVTAYSISPTTGALTNIGSVSSNGSPSSIAVDPTGKYIYVANRSTNIISAFNINATTGLLTSVGTFSTNNTPIAITIDPTGNYVYVAHETSSNIISAYSINSNTGALTSIGTFAAGSFPRVITVDPTGKFVFVGNYMSRDISAYSINSGTGMLTSVGTFAAGGSPMAITVDPTGKFILVPYYATNIIAVFAINATSGALTNIGTIGHVAQSGWSGNPMSIAVTKVR